LNPELELQKELQRLDDELSEIIEQGKGADESLTGTLRQLCKDISKRESYAAQDFFLTPRERVWLEDEDAARRVDEKIACAPARVLFGFLRSLQ
jgi:hypothetical protein